MCGNSVAVDNNCVGVFFVRGLPSSASGGRHVDLIHPRRSSALCNRSKCIRLRLHCGSCSSLAKHHDPNTISCGLGDLSVPSRAGNVGLGLGSRRGKRIRMAFSLGAIKDGRGLAAGISLSGVRLGWREIYRDV